MRQLRELIRLKRVTGLTGKEYFMYGFYRPEMAWEEKLRFLTRALHEAYLAPLDPPAYSALVSDKHVFRLHLRAAGLPVAREFGVFHPLVGADASGRPLRTREELAALLAALPPGGLVAKPVRGGCGSGVLVFSGKGDDGSLVHVNGERYPLERLHAALCARARLDSPGYLLEERVAQHPFLDAYRETTLHSTRVVTIEADDGTVHVVGATLKIGMDDSGVESMPERHLVVPVDTQSGLLGPGVVREGVGFRSTAVHPVSGRQIEGEKLPMWLSMREAVLRAAATVPMVRSLGWDVGLSPDGPVIIEANEIWGEDILQIALRRGIWTPEFRALIGAPATL